MRIVDSWEIRTKTTTIGLKMYYCDLEAEDKISFAITPEKARCLSKALREAVRRIESATKRKIISQDKLDERLDKFLEAKAAIKDENSQGPPNQEAGKFENTNN